MTDTEDARARRLARIEELGAVLETYKAAEPGPRFMGDIPERWMDGDMRWRCPNGHVRGGYIKSEEFGGDCCQPCYSDPAERGTYVRISFPEDTEGPLAPRPVPETAARCRVCAHVEDDHDDAQELDLDGRPTTPVYAVCHQCVEDDEGSVAWHAFEPPAPPAEIVEEAQRSEVCGRCDDPRADHPIIQSASGSRYDRAPCRKCGCTDYTFWPVEVEGARPLDDLDEEWAEPLPRLINTRGKWWRFYWPGLAGVHSVLVPNTVETAISKEGEPIVDAARAYRDAFDQHLAMPSVATRLARDDAKEALLRVARGDQ